MELQTQLVNQGYANDGQYLGSVAFEEKEKVVQDLQEVGYTQHLDSGSHYFTNHGQMYWLFDPSMLTDSQAHHLTKKWVNDFKEG
ncbi:hypothetical protein J4729_14135 [Leisingera sp. HS039]|uniref:hypothetical protein n=1 Tax=Leisingera sp. HS039 TaxID=2818496 RepID=UPI001B39F1AE|nr:hypothetical protein [Leisingera sp. HS039]MBQ4825679.1 hypothetical protein [Leisingera sp. HS039]